MELRQLEHFVAVAVERHFTHAADLLHISQSGLSASIRALESELGATLFVRTTRQVELTAAGRALLPEAQRTLAASTAARGAVDAVSGLLVGSVAVGSEACPGVLHLARELASFRRGYPGIELRLVVDGSAALLDNVAHGRTDVAVVVPTGPVPSGIDLTPLGVESLVVLSHPSRPFVEHGQVALQELTQETFVDFRDGASSRVLTSRAFGAVGHTYRVELEVNDVHLLLDLILEDLGIAVVPRSIARKRSDDLAATPITDPLPQWQVCVATKTGASPAATVLRAQLLADAQRNAKANPQPPLHLSV